jgi:hypothetical protein
MVEIVTGMELAALTKRMKFLVARDIDVDYLVW